MNTLHLVDPELRPLLDSFPAIALTEETLPLLRTALASPAERVDTQSTLERRKVPGPADAPELELSIYRPAAAAGHLPCIYHIHGGGFVAGSADFSEPFHRALCTELQCAIVSVEYRLAPETPFPGAIEDCYAGLGWLLRNADEIGVDAGRVGVMGESAGGGLAAALALLVRDRRELRLHFQHLIYPMLDDRTGTNAPHPFAGEFIWTPENNRFGWRSLLGRAPGTNDVPPYAAPARADDLSGLPPAFLAVGALDLFIDENLEYARRLMHAGVPVELHVYPGAFHGFDLELAGETNATVVRQLHQDRTRALARALRAPDSGLG